MVKTAATVETSTMIETLSKTVAPATPGTPIIPLGANEKVKFFVNWIAISYNYREYQ